MATEPTPESDSTFDISRIRQLVRLMRDNDLAEIDLRLSQMRIRLRRGAEGAVTTAVTPSVARAVVPPTVMAAADTSTAAPPPAPPVAPAATTSRYITSPIVGTFYGSPNPDAEPFVKIGTRVTAETTVCIIEAMKVFNEIPAGIAGTIAEVLVNNGSAVEYGQNLFRVEA